jgi:AsmA family protein
MGARRRFPRHAARRGQINSEALRMSQPREPGSVSKRRRLWPRWCALALAGLFGCSIALWWFWDWNWLRPMAEARLSALFGRSVTLQRFDVAFVPSSRWTIDLTGYGLTIDNPNGIEGPDFATVPRVMVRFAAGTWWRTGRVVLPLIAMDQPRFNVIQTASGQSNWLPAIPLPGTVNGSPPLEIDDVEVNDGDARVQMARGNANVDTTIVTSHAAGEETLVVSGKGSYSGQPITFHAVGGAVLSLMNKTKPYPIDFTLTSGETKIILKGHVDDPFAFTGADLDLAMSGSDMASLFPFIGIPTPSTPPYRIVGRTDFANKHIHFTHIVGKVGSSDLNGDLDVDPNGEREVLTGTLVSHQVDIADLAGFVGSLPGHASTPGQSPRQIEERQHAAANPRLLPTTPISVPKLHAADVHISYRGERITGMDAPFESIATKLDIDNGHIRLAPLQIGIGGGTMKGIVDLNPVDDRVDSDIDLALRGVDIGRLLQSFKLGNGRGAIDGSIKVTGRGASVSEVLAHGDGEFRAVMPNGGDISALLVDLLGLEAANSLFAAIGIPTTEQIQCAVVDFQLRQGILASRALEISTTDHVISGGGRIDLSRELVEMTLRTDPKHFTIGKLAAPISIYGPFKHLSYGVSPDAAVRGGAVIALGFLFPPAAILPTIQFGVGESSPCGGAQGQPRVTK